MGYCSVCSKRFTPLWPTLPRRRVDRSTPSSTAIVACPRRIPVPTMHPISAPRRPPKAPRRESELPKNHVQSRSSPSDKSKSSDEDEGRRPLPNGGSIASPLSTRTTTIHRPPRSRTRPPHPKTTHCPRDATEGSPLRFQPSSINCWRMPKEQGSATWSTGCHTVGRFWYSTSNAL